MDAKELEEVDLIASGYEWTCPNCDELNHEIEITETVCCKDCKQKYSTGETHHAYD
jgi:uncharacterized protein (DUF983 family)